MRIALDWDETFTRSPRFWRDFVLLAWKAGHEVRIVTFRHPNNLGDIRATLNKFQMVDKLPTIATNYIQKRTACNALGWLPDVWIDDSPEFIVENN